MLDVNIKKHGPKVLNGRKYFESKKKFFSVQGICNTIVSSVFTNHNDSMYMNGKIKYEIL